MAKKENKGIKIRPAGSKHNPVIATAKRKIPGRWTKTKKWVRAHRRTIFLTAQGIAALGLLYYFLKVRDMRRQEEYQKTMNILISEEAQHLNDIHDDNLKMVGFLEKFVKKLYNDPDFHAFLKQKGYDDVNFRFGH